jgi:hypothetical protein
MAELRVAARGHMHGTPRSVPQRLDELFRATNEGFVIEALAIAGASDARMAWESPEPGAFLGGTRVHTLSFHVHW